MLQLMSLKGAQGTGHVLLKEWDQSLIMPRLLSQWRNWSETIDHLNTVAGLCLRE